MTKKRTLLCLLLALIMIVSVLPARRSAKADVSDGYYLIGPNWTIDALGGKFTQNGSSEYMLQTTVSAGQKIKVVHVESGAITEWFPDGEGTEYTVDVENGCPTGSVTIFFRPGGLPEWSSTGGYFYIVKNYAVTCAEATGGTVTANYTQASFNTVVTLTVTPEEGYRIGSVSYNDGSDHVITPDGGEYKFTMPEHDVTVTATFKDTSLDPANGYYLIGPDWTIDSLQSDVFLNIGTGDFEYMQQTTLTAEQKIKVVHVQDGEIDGWYPPGEGNEYTVPADLACSVTVFFRPYHYAEWDPYGTGGYFYIGKNYAINLPAEMHGTIVRKINDKTVTEASRDTIVTLTVTPDEGWALESLKVISNSNGAEITLTQNADDPTVYTFTMPESAVTVTPTFTALNTITVNVLGDASKIGYALMDATTNTEITDNTILAGHTLKLTVAKNGVQTLDFSVSFTDGYGRPSDSNGTDFDPDSSFTWQAPLGEGPVTITLIVDPVCLILNGNGGKGPHDEGETEQQIAPNTDTTIRANEFTNAGYAFAGWNTEANGSGTPYADGATINVSGDTTLYAQWEELPKSTITVNVLGDASKIGYTLTDLTTNTEITDDTIPVGHQLRIRMYPVSESITLVFKVVWTDSEGEVHVRDILSPVLLSNPTSNIGWSDGIGSGPVTVTIYVNPIKLTLDGNGGITEDEETTVADWFPANYDAEIPGNPFTYEGHVFTGWKDGSGTPVGGTINVSGDTTLYAQWQSFYTITVNNGTADKAAASAGETVTITANEPESGMAFVEWAQVDGVTYQNGASVETTFTMPEKDVTLTANYASIIIEEIDSRIYTGLPIEPDDISVYLDGVDLSLTNEDYDLEFQSNVDAGTATVTVTMTAPRAGSASATFQITPASISNAIVTAENRTADGTEQTPEPTVIWNDQVLEKGKDYEIDSYADNVQPGTATVTVKGKGNFVGTVSGTFEIAAPIAYTVTVTNDGNGTAGANPASGTTGQEVTLSASPSEGYQFKEWQVLSGGVTIADNKFTIGMANVEIKAIFEEIKNPETESPEPTATDEPVYEITEGKDGSWTKLSNKTYRVVVKRVGDDENCFAHFSGVSIDGKALVLNTDFTAEKGSTVITIKVETLETLKVGDHTLTVQFDDGTVETTLKVVRNYDAEPGTGDRTHPALWFGVMSVCAVGLLTLLVFAAKRRREDY